MTVSLVETLRLLEVRGRIPELDSILNTFSQKLKGKIETISLPAEVVLRTEDLQANNSFFENIWVKVSVRRGLYTKATGRVSTKNLKLTKGKKLNWVSITLEVVWDPEDSLDELVDKISSDFSHEITHAYEEYKRLLHGAPSLDAEDYQTRYGKIRQGAESIPEHIVKSILYFTDKVERKAFLAEMYNEAKRLVPKVSSGNELYKAVLRNSQAGQSYLACKELLGYWPGGKPYYGENIVDMADRETPGWQAGLVRTWNSIYGTSLQTVGEVQIKLETLWNRFESVFKNKLGKIIQDVWDSKEERD